MYLVNVEGDAQQAIINLCPRVRCRHPHQKIRGGAGMPLTPQPLVSLTVARSLPTSASLL